MAQNPNESATIGTVTAIVGEVKATGTDGVVRVLTAGDTVATGEVIETSANGAVHIQLANGRALECGPRFSGTLNPGLLDLASGTRIALDGSIVNPAVAAVPAPADIATTPVTPGAIPQDIAALQAAIAGGADPSRIAEASAAGGAAPGAGGADGGGGTPLLIEQANSQGQVTSGIDGSGGKPLGFPDLTTTQQTAAVQPEGPPLIPPPPTPPVISVDITGIRLVPPSDPEVPPEEITVSGNIVSLVEGTSPGVDPGKILNFVLVLDKASDVDVTVTYTITAQGEQNDIDLVDLLGGTVIVPAGATQILVPIKISQDHNVETDDSFELVITSATNATINPDASTAILNIINDDEPPLAQDDAYTVNEGENGTTLLSSVLTRTDSGESTDDGGADVGEILTVTSTGTIATTQGGQVQMNADGTFHYFAPNAEFNGTDSFSYTMTDGFNGESEAVVTITVTAVNDVPNAVDNAYSVNEDSVLTIALPGVLAGDTTGGDGGVLAVTSYTQPAHGTLTLDASGGFVYTPTANYNGPDSFTYTIEDADGDADTATVAITVNPVNDVPNAVDNAYSVAEDGVLIVTGILGNDSVGGDGGTLAVIANTQPSHGTLLLNSNGSFTYTPAANYNGPDSFTYTIQDADGDTDTATVAITVNPVNDLPNAADNAYSVNEDSVLTIALPGVLAGDTTGGDGGVLAVTSYTQPAHGTLTLDANGGFVYTPAANYNGPDSFTYTIEDADGDTDTATVAITVNPVNDAPAISITGGAHTVYESGLPSGSDIPPTTTVATGSFTLADTDGLDDLVSIKVNSTTFSMSQLDAATDTPAGRLLAGNTAAGELYITGYDAGTGVVSYRYELSAAIDDVAGVERNTFAVRVSDDGVNFSAPATITVTIVDDLPAIDPVDTLLAAEIGTLSTASLNLVAGADGIGTLVITGETNEAGQVVDVAGNVLTSNESPMTYMQSGGVLYAVTVQDDIESAVFSVTPNGPSGTYTIQLLGALDATKVVLSATFNGTDAGSPDDPYTVQFADQTGTNVQVSHLFGFGDLEVNPSNDGLGSGANVISMGDQVGVWLGTQVSSVDIGLSNFASHGGNTTSLSWTAFNVDETAVDIANYPDVGDDAGDSVYSLTEFFDSIHVSGSDLMGVVTAGGPAVVIGSAVGGSSVTAPQGASEEADIDTYALTPGESALFDFVLIEQTDGSMKINGMSFESGAITDDIRINLQATVTDGDLDVAANSFQVTFSGGGEGGYTLTGGAADEVLQGGGGNDILIGGGGVDVLTGGDGSDTFKFTDAASADVVKDFDVAGGDALDVRDLLPAAVQGSTNADTLGAYLQLVADGDGNTVVMIDADGAAGAASPTPMVTLEGVTGVSLADLLASDQLKT